jgi:hypothetical protein
MMTNFSIIAIFLVFLAYDDDIMVHYFVVGIIFLFLIYFIVWFNIFKTK